MSLPTAKEITVSEHDDREKPGTAAEEVLHEVEEAGHRTRDPGGAGDRRGEAGDAVTPNTEAQEESRGDR
ncbi:hypothetical protein GCM10010261_36530 [Streptomyces pilosus]|uniref:Uncharacterized protein n=1 Tax=Streptomyces pilosus TaxID=28893 RepID=A0A918BH68_9ACTN|nr:hypothetical protein GCM10010280_13630 [Streptomyces pilosus]GGV54217.1 hypothetical protein GCM10010261_36530 [Streptomyces pilosus]